MLTVKTTIRPSGIEGNGVFAEEDIPKGTVIWTFVEGFDLVYTDEQIAKFPQQAQEHFRRYSFRQDGKVILTVDNDRFTNHSSEPNTIPLPNGDFAAAVDIKKGEEITADYLSFDESCNYYEHCTR